MIRLYVEQALRAGQAIALDADQAHYISSVMRKSVGDGLLLFNGQEGEWQGEIIQCRKKNVEIQLTHQTRDQEETPDIWLLFAPIKKNRLDFLVEKATELGVSALWPVITQRTITSKVRTDRLSAQVIEAAEQCERLNSPQVKDPVAFGDIAKDWPDGRVLYILDEQGGAPAVAEVFQAGAQEGTASAILVGPEGGFDGSELDLLSKLPFVKRVSLGPRILRAETAAIAALSCWQALQGDWDAPLRLRNGGEQP